MAASASFGTVFIDQMSVVRWVGGVWDAPKLTPVEPLPLHPAAHALHYGSSCFEGLKAHRGVDGVVRVFRLDRHVARLRRSTEALVLPTPPADLLSEMIVDVVRAGLADIPESPGSLYLRPTLIGTDPNIGAAAHPTGEAMLFVLGSPVGDYFAGGLRPLALALETDRPRTTPLFGMVKTGANYAMALGITLQAGRDLGVDQILFAPGGQVQETGASNFLLLDDERVITPERSSAFLHGVTLDSMLHIAADLGYRVEEREVNVDEVLAWAAHGEAALSGTAAVLAPVGELVYQGRRIAVGDGGIGPNTLRLRETLTRIHRAELPAPHGWMTEVRA